MSSETNSGEKHQYSPQEIVYSSGWCIDDFRLADRNRQLERERKKQQDAQTLGILYQIIEDENIVSLAYFVKLLYEQYPELTQIYSSKAVQIRDYISSRRYDITCGFVDYPYNKVCEMLKHEQSRTVQLDNKITKQCETINEYEKWLKQYQEQVAQLKQSLYEQQLFTQKLLARNSELLGLLEFEELPISDTQPEEGVENITKGEKKV